MERAKIKFTYKQEREYLGKMVEEYRTKFGMATTRRKQKDYLECVEIAEERLSNLVVNLNEKKN